MYEDLNIYQKTRQSIDNSVIEANTVLPNRETVLRRKLASRSNDPISSSASSVLPGNDPSSESSSLLDKSYSRIPSLVHFTSLLFPGDRVFKGNRFTWLHLSLVEVGRQGPSSCHRGLLSNRSLTYGSTKRLHPVPHALHALWCHRNRWQRLHDWHVQKDHGTSQHRIP